MSRKPFYLLAMLIISALLFTTVDLPALAAPPGQEQNPPERTRPDQYSYVGPENMGLMPDPSGTPSEQFQIAPGAIVPWSKIVFQSYRDDNWEIYAANGDGSNPVRLTWDSPNGPVDMHPRYNRGCTRIVFSSDRNGPYQLFTMNPDGSDVIQLTFTNFDAVYPYWSPDGTRIVFQYYLDGQAEIYVINADGSNLTRLTADADYDGMPSWSPDGTRIPFISHRSGGYSVWVMSADGTNPYILPTQPYSQHPIFSPDNSKILYDSDSDGDGWQDLWVMNWDGTNQQYIRGGQVQIDDWSNSWSPDGYYRGFSEVGFVYYNGQWYWSSGNLYGMDPIAQFWVDLNPNNYTEWNFDWQTTDGQSPITAMSPLALQSPATFVVSWTGYDPGDSGFMNYDLQYLDNTVGTWTDWQLGATVTSSEFTGLGGHTYYFRVRGRDNAYNLEPWPDGYDAYTIVENIPPVTEVQALPEYTRNEALIQWSGYDSGGSGILGYDVQYREEPYGSWTDWFVNTSIKSAIFTGVPGTTYSFRSRGTDRAYNIESWWDWGDTSTTLYTWGVYGTATDNRGGPVSDMTITTNPGAFATLPGDADGSYGAFVLEEADNYSAAWDKQGYLGLPLTSFTPDQGGNTNISLPPLDNVIMDWGLESGGPSPDWRLSGLYTPVITYSTRHTGNYGLLFSPPEVGFSDPENLSNNGNLPHLTRIAISPDGTIHVIWSEGTNSHIEVFYTQRPSGGTWTPPINLSNTPEQNSDIQQLIVDSSGAVHVFWEEQIDYYTKHLYYARRDPDGSWSIPIDIIPNGNSHSAPETRVYMDSSGVLHVIWSTGDFYTSSSIAYVQGFPDGSWTSPVILSTTDLARYPDFVIDRDNRLQVVWIDTRYGDLYYTHRDPDGIWSTPISLSSNTVGYPELEMDPNGRVHMVYGDSTPALNYRYLDGEVWSSVETFFNSALSQYLSLKTEPDGQVNVLWKDNTGTIRYQHRSSNGMWSSVRLIGTSFFNPDTALDGAGNLIVVWSNVDLLYTKRSSDGSWSDTMVITPPGADAYSPRIAIDSYHRVHLAYMTQDTMYIGPGQVEETGTGEASQAITVPVSMTAPTLSFWYQAFDVSQAGNTWFDLQVQDEISTTEIFRDDVSTLGWTHQWVDMSNWSGQTITLTYRLSQQAGSQPASAFLDEVTLGSAHPDTWVSLSGGALGAHPGDQITYQLDYGNRGGALAAASAITLTLPSGLNFLDASIPPVIVGDQLVWQVGDLPAGSDLYSISLTVEVDAAAPLGDTVVTSVEITTASTELETLNNSAQSETFLGYLALMPIIHR
jgi:uncharacterized repeat protein (TIGR01451 family)